MTIHKFTGGSRLGDCCDGARSPLPLGLRNLRFRRKSDDPLRLALHLRRVPTHRRQVLKDRGRREQNVPAGVVLKRAQMSTKKHEFRIRSSSSSTTTRWRGIRIYPIDEKKNNRNPCHTYIVVPPLLRSYNNLVDFKEDFLLNIIQKTN